MAKAKKESDAPDAAEPTKGDDPLSLHYGSSQPGHGIILTPSQKAAQGPAQDLVKMDVLADRSYAGKSHKAGDSIDVHPDHVEALTLSGFAARSDRAERAEAARNAPAARAEALKNLTGSDSTTVKPITTHDVPGAEPPKE